jgi:hypothetical protein
MEKNSIFVDHCDLKDDPELTKELNPNGIPHCFNFIRGDKIFMQTGQVQQVRDEVGKTLHAL